MKNLNFDLVDMGDWVMILSATYSPLFHDSKSGFIYSLEDINRIGKIKELIPYTGDIKQYKKDILEAFDCDHVISFPVLK